MDLFALPDIMDMFALETPLLEIFIRGSCTYLLLFTLLRLVLKRMSGTVNTTDLLMIVLIADAAQNGMAGEYKTISDGILLVATLIFWNYILDWISFHLPVLGQWIRPPALKLVENGAFLHDHMRRELISEEEMMSHLREQGVQSVEEVKQAFMEGDGRISVCAYPKE